MKKYECAITEMYPWLITLAMGFCRNKDDAYDLAQDTICKLLEHRARTPNLRAYAATIMRNLRINGQAHKNCLKMCRLDKCAEPLARERHPERSLTLASVRKLMRTMKSVQCVMLKAEGYTHKEIGVLMNLDANGVHNSIDSGRRYLRAMFGH